MSFLPGQHPYNDSPERTYVQSNQADSEGRRFEMSLSGDYRQTLSSENFVFAGDSTELHLLGVAKPNQSE